MAACVGANTGAEAFRDAAARPCASARACVLADAACREQGNATCSELGHGNRNTTAGIIRGHAREQLRISLPPGGAGAGAADGGTNNANHNNRTTCTPLAGLGRVVSELAQHILASLRPVLHAANPAGEPAGSLGDPAVSIGDGGVSVQMAWSGDAFVLSVWGGADCRAPITLGFAGSNVLFALSLESGRLTLADISPVHAGHGAQPRCHSMTLRPVSPTLPPEACGFFDAHWAVTGLLPTEPANERSYIKMGVTGHLS